MTGPPVLKEEHQQASAAYQAALAAWHDVFVATRAGQLEQAGQLLDDLKTLLTQNEDLSTLNIEQWSNVRRPAYNFLRHMDELQEREVQDLEVLTEASPRCAIDLRSLRLLERPAQHVKSYIQYKLEQAPENEWLQKLSVRAESIAKLISEQISHQEQAKITRASFQPLAQVRARIETALALFKRVIPVAHDRAPKPALKAHLHP